jgi:2,3-bisphosphoglycerate-independent phosphoglycerate mutase
MDFNFIRELVTHADTKIVMLVMDGLGGLPIEAGGRTELETARTPNLDALAEKSALGLTVPLGAGITVESGPGHLALFGYDPFDYRIGRGVLEAVGIEFNLQPDDIAVRGNYCTVNADGIVADRRAARIPNEISKELSKLLTTRIEDVDIFVETVREHRLAIIMRGPGLSAEVGETDPLKNGLRPLPVRALKPDAEKTARVVKQFIERSRRAIESYRSDSSANMILMRGFDRYPHFPAFPEVFGLRAAAIAVYPTYRGIARLVGMQVLPVEGSTFADEFTVLEKNWTDFDFFYLHIKNTDLAGEDGDFARKVSIIEEVDAMMPRLLELKPDVCVICGDHSTPALLKGHSWHPVPFLLYSPFVRADGIAEFGEHACARGSLGTFPAKDVMPLAMANALRLLKFSS